ncbi:hypothetical protein CDD83_7436 [Cordyceps sp. RAO-2017]|nr:hypothetical protein CDD83_7436 [Cordyceps sp. RAO-2017]
MAESTGWHISKNLFLLSLSLVLQPISSAVIIGFAAWNKCARLLARHAPVPPPRRRTVLVTGVNMSKGLCLARLFHRKGHRVVGADCHALAPGRLSSALDSFHVLPRPGPSSSGDEGSRDPYVLGILDIVRNEAVDLWISVSDVNAAAHDALARDLVEARTEARAAQLSLKDVQVLHEKHTFIQHARSLGLSTPDTQLVASKGDITDFLAKRGGLRLEPGRRQYLLKPIGVNDQARFNMPLLPLSSEEETVRRIESLPMGGGPEFIMQEFIRGPEFCTHALVVRGRVRAFVACPSSELLMHYAALPGESPLSRKMLAFTERMAKAGGADWTGHVSFDFLVEERQLDSKSGQDDALIYPIECNPRVHTAVVLFNDTPEMVDEYLRILEPDLDGDEELLSPRSPQRYYWVGQDLVESAIYPVYQSLVLRSLSLSQMASSLASFAHRLWGWKDGTFEAWDPWPWWWLYHVYWPMQFLAFLFRGRWHKVNVSTGKAFEAS